MLDLHANPQATGTRFEDPSWYLRLPSLKPIGLNAMLTYISTEPVSKFGGLAAKSDDNNILDEVCGTSNSGSVRATDRKEFRRELSSRPSFEDLIAAKGTSIRSTRSRSGDRDSISKAAIVASMETNRRNGKALEASLVDHVRRAIPIEALRELAEEIGFVEEDIALFTRLLEMNVLAPHLSDIRLLEDTHAWGQEETRRRGTLVPQVSMCTSNSIGS